MRIDPKTYATKTEARKAAPVLIADITVNQHPVHVHVEGAGALTPAATLRQITEHVKAIEAQARLRDKTAAL